MYYCSIDRADNEAYYSCWVEWNLSQLLDTIRALTMKQLLAAGGRETLNSCVCESRCRIETTILSPLLLMELSTNTVINTLSNDQEYNQPSY